jgi:hypothetical protein
MVAKKSTDVTDTEENTPVQEYEAGVIVARKIHELREKIKTIAPSKMDTGRFSYNYLSESALTNAIRPVLQELGLIVYPIYMSSSTESYEMNEGKRVLLSKAEATYRVVDTETGDWVDIQSIGAGSDTGDKGVNKANTCAFKNMLRSLGMFPSPEREDPDTTASPAGKRATSSRVSPGDTLIKYGTYAGKTIHELFNEDPELVEELCNGKNKWLADKAKDFLSTIQV